MPNKFQPSAKPIYHQIIVGYNPELKIKQHIYAI